MAEKFAALKAASSRIDFAHNDAPKCPHCGETIDIADNELWRIYSEDETHDVECPHCDGEFQVETFARFTFSTDDQDGE